MITKIAVRSNGDAVLTKDDGTTTTVCMLDQLINKLQQDKLVDENCIITISMCPEPIKITQWYEIKSITQ